MEAMQNLLFAFGLLSLLLVVVGVFLLVRRLASFRQRTVSLGR